jgi:hypothetical protein
MDIGFIPGRDRHRRPIPFKKSFIQRIDGLHKRQFEMQPRFGDRVTHRFPELSDNHLFSLINRINRQRNNQYPYKNRRQN